MFSSFLRIDIPYILQIYYITLHYIIISVSIGIRYPIDLPSFHGLKPPWPSKKSGPQETLASIRAAAAASAPAGTRFHLEKMGFFTSCQQ